MRFMNLRTAVWRGIERFRSSPVMPVVSASTRRALALVSVGIPQVLRGELNNGIAPRIRGISRALVRSRTTEAQVLSVKSVAIPPGRKSAPSRGASSSGEAAADEQRLADLDASPAVLSPRKPWERADVDTERVMETAPPVTQERSTPETVLAPAFEVLLQRARAWVTRHVRPVHIIAGIALVLSVASYLYYAHLGVTLAYDDALSHMMIARRVVAGRTPGLAQLGQFWLPLTHILMLAFIWNNWLFHTGLAGTIPSMVAYIVGAIYMYRLARECFGTGTAGWLAASAWMLNPNLIYMQATAMTEAPLICTAVMVIYYAVRWVKDYAPIDLVKAAAAAMAATLIRYDGWPLALGLAVIILVVAWRREKSEGTIANGILFGFLAFSGCVGWILYNQILFGDAIGWYNGKYSASYQEQRIAAKGGLPSYHNLLLSFHLYLQSVVDTVSLPIIILAVFSIVIWALYTRLQMSTWPLYLLLIPFAFNWLALVQGSTIIRTPEIPVNGTATWFNVRYGMEMIPLIALFLGVLVAHRFVLLRRVTLAICLALLALVMITNTFGHLPYVLDDALRGGNANSPIQQRVIGQYLAEHYSGGLMLLSYSPFAPAVFYSALPDDDFLTDGNGAQYDAALADPPKADVTWILMDPGSINYDPISSAAKARPTFLQGYVLAATFGTAQLYERTSNASANR